MVNIASWSPTWWATHVASLIFLGTITRASVRELIGVGSLWPSRFRGIGLFESMIRATTYPLTHHPFELAVFLAFLAVKRTGVSFEVPRFTCLLTYLLSSLTYTSLYHIIHAIYSNHYRHHSTSQQNQQGLCSLTTSTGGLRRGVAGGAGVSSSGRCGMNFKVASHGSEELRKILILGSNGRL